MPAQPPFPDTSDHVGDDDVEDDVWEKEFDENGRRVRMKRR